MRPNMLLPSAGLLLFLFLFLSPTTTTATAISVLDTKGRPVRVKANYHILPVIRGQGGGLTLLPKNNTKSCPLLVGQEFQEVSTGPPLKLIPSDSKGKHIVLSSDLNIEFDASTICITSSVWSLTFDEGSGRHLVGIGGALGNPGVGTLGNWFKIEKAETGKNDYTIVYCPSVCPKCRLFCGQLGVFVEDDGRRLLAFSDKPLVVRFKKA